MIWESYYWRQDLLKLAKKLEARTKQKRFPERSLVNFDKEIFMAFYIVRKLAEAKKLSDSITNSALPAYSSPALGKSVHFFNWDRIDELYDFEKQKRQSLSLAFVCNQIIHSYIFLPCFDENSRLCGIFFSSDKERNKRLFYLDISEVIRLLREIGNDEVPGREYVFDEEKGDYTMTEIPREPSPESGDGA